MLYLLNSERRKPLNKGDYLGAQLLQDCSIRTADSRSYSNVFNIARL